MVQNGEMIVDFGLLKHQIWHGHTFDMLINFSYGPIPKFIWGGGGVGHFSGPSGEGWVTIWQDGEMIMHFN